MASSSSSSSSPVATASSHETSDAGHAHSASAGPLKQSALARVSALLARVLKDRTRIGKELRTLPERMEKVAKQCALLLEMIDDVAAGRLDEVPWRSVVVGAVALLYATSPADIVPDALPILGTLDDMVVLTLAMRVVRRDLEAYGQKKGYDMSRYF